MGKHAYPPLPTRPRLVLAVYPALLFRVTVRGRVRVGGGFRVRVRVRTSVRAG